ncbi:MAG: 50S ribosomal protein L22 [SAR86 cluster bacterium]|jgi:large subunit ribosomal protein L22|nr:50S ribosomal protein L22 [SAR86 cluster bacterium]|tara:strand:+ start:9544 stop:9882 length:339 start_codon:yes stop_codon:yes gene_type:complete
MTEVNAKLKSAKISPRKVALVANQIRGKNVGQALDILTFEPQKSARIIKKVLNSAIANAQNNNGLDVDSLYVSSISVNDSFTLKRIRPRARGRADRVFKRSCNIYLTVSNGN